MSEKNSDLGAFLAGFVIGGLVGAATALILAPQSGEETRNKIRETSGQLSQSSNEYLQNYSQKATEMAQPYRERANVALNDARTRLSETGGKVQEQARTALDSSKEKATQLKDQVSSYVQKSTNGNDDGTSAVA